MNMAGNSTPPEHARSGQETKSFGHCSLGPAERSCDPKVVQAPRALSFPSPPLLSLNWNRPYSEHFSCEGCELRCRLRGVTVVVTVL